MSTFFLFFGGAKGRERELGEKKKLQEEEQTHTFVSSLSFTTSLFLSLNNNRRVTSIELTNNACTVAFDGG